MDDSENSEPRVEAPIGLLPDLDSWGIEEVERGICADTSENRSIIREHKARWLPVFTNAGEPTQLIQVVTKDMQTARANQNKKFLLKNPQDIDSDYRTGVSLIIDPQVDNAIPAWVLAATRKYLDVEEERQRRRKDGDLKPYRPSLAELPGRCRAMKLDNHRCWNWHGGRAEEDGLCKMHITTHRTDEEFGPNALTRARNKVLSTAVAAVEVLEEIALTATSEPTRVQAANSLLDRAGLRGGQDINHEVTVVHVDAAEEIRKRLAGLAKADERRKEVEAARVEALARVDAEDAEEDEDIVDAEVVEVEVRGENR